MLPLFKQWYIHVFYPVSHTQRTAHPPLLLPPTDKQALETKLEQIIVEALKEGQCYSLWGSKDIHINEAVCLGAVLGLLRTGSSMCLIINLFVICVTRPYFYPLKLLIA